MKACYLLAIGTGSVMNIVDAMIQENLKIKVAVIDIKTRSALHSAGIHTVVLTLWSLATGNQVG